MQSNEINWRSNEISELRCTSLSRRSRWWGEVCKCKEQKLRDANEGWRMLTKDADERYQWLKQTKKRWDATKRCKQKMRPEDATRIGNQKNRRGNQKIHQTRRWETRGEASNWKQLFFLSRGSVVSSSSAEWAIIIVWLIKFPICLQPKTRDAELERQPRECSLLSKGFPREEPQLEVLKSSSSGTWLWPSLVYSQWVSWLLTIG